VSHCSRKEFCSVTVGHFFELAELLIKRIDASLDREGIGLVPLHSSWGPSDLRSDFEHAFRYGGVIHAVNTQRHASQETTMLRHSRLREG
jgi:hypothetical protein